ncbi:MAG: class I SAM-dependent methyltransferase [Hahellaceae bacterium]|nr:class I SAM-dependent methyltransferase [Hahellaceae bacterium]
MSELTGHSLVVTVEAGGNEAHAKSFAERYRLPLVERMPEEGLALTYSREGVALIPTGKGAPGPVSASFIDGVVEHRRKFGGGKGQLIAKAVGLKPGIFPRVLDATAGLGKDAFVLATLGCNVTLLERSPVIVELLRAAIEEAAGHIDVAAIVARMELVHQDSLVFMEEKLETKDLKIEKYDVVYLDPMFPHREKSALVKKEMRVFRDIVGEDLDSSELLAKALQLAEYRVVVKRPRKAPVLGALKPSLVFEGKSSRYDIYTKKSMDGLKG